MRAGTSAVFIIVIAATAVPLGAQEHNSLAVGLNYAHRIASDKDSRGTGAIGISLRVGHRDEGWGWTYGLGWFTTNLERSISGRRMRFGELHVRPIVGGYGYTHELSRRWSLTGDVVGGFAFTSLDVTAEASDALQAQMNADAIDVHVGAVPIFRPELRAWYDISPKLGASIGGWYALARPLVTLTTDTSRERFRLNADTLSVSAGLVYRVF